LYVSEEKMCRGFIDSREKRLVIMSLDIEGTEIDLASSIMALNSSVSSPLFLSNLVQIATAIAIQLESNQQFRRVPASEGSTQSNLPKVSFENVVWALDLLVSGWIGYMLESKAICHSGRRHHADHVNLVEHVIPSILDAFEVGRQKAVEDKQREGRLDSQIAPEDSDVLEGYLEDHDDESC
jgi:hypothetical protein